MQLSIVALFIGASLATPVTTSDKLAARDGAMCGNLLYGVPQCCSTGVLGILSLDCKNPMSANDPTDFKKSCGDAGSSAMCCTVPLASLALLCKDAI